MMKLARGWVCQWQSSYWLQLWDFPSQPSFKCRKENMIVSTLIRKQSILTVGRTPCSTMYRSSITISCLMLSFGHSLGKMISILSEKFLTFKILNSDNQRSKRIKWKNILNFNSELCGKVLLRDLLEIITMKIPFKRFTKWISCVALKSILI